MNPKSTQIIYAGARNTGILKSTDGGTNWAPANTGLVNLDIESLVIDPQNPLTLYAGGYPNVSPNGIYRTTDGGDHWTKLNKGLGNLDFQALAVGPVSPMNVYVGTTAGLFKSIDRGDNWQELNTGLAMKNILSLAVHPQNSSVVYAGAWGEGVVVSNDGGNTWASLNVGLTNLNITSLAIDPKTPSTVYAGTLASGVFVITTDLTPSAQIQALRQVDGAVAGASAKLEAQIKNTGILPLSADSNVRFYVEGPNMPINWAGSTSTAGLAPGATQWYSFNWLIPANASAGRYTYYAEVWQFSAISQRSAGMGFDVTRTGPPGKATLVSPNGTISTATPAYVWNAVPTAAWYRLYANDSTSPPAKVDKWYTAEQAGCSSGTGTCSVTPSTALSAGAAQWWIQAWSDAGTGPWSDGLTFAVAGGGPPGKATLISPNGAISSTTPAYSWNAVSGATWYLLWVNSTAGSGVINKWYSAEQLNCASGTGACSVTPAIPLAAGNAQWWIQTWNNSGYGQWSDGMSFTVEGGGVPGKATLVSPNGTISSGTPAYVWNAVAGSTWYRLWVGNSTGAGIIDAWYTAEQAGCASGSGTCSVTPATTVPAGAAQWWIRTWNSSGDGPWSDGMSFNVLADQKPTGTHMYIP